MGVRAGWAAAFLAILTATAAKAGSLYYATAQPGPSQGSGGSVDQLQWLATRFDVSNTVTVDAVGGHFLGGPLGNGLIFGAIARLTSDQDIPDSEDLSTPDVLAHITFAPPYPSADVVQPFPLTTLTPGKYALLYGAGLWGTTGGGAMPNFEPLIGTPSHFLRNSDLPGHWSDLPVNQNTAFRFTVYTVVPEPAAIGSLLCLSPLLPRRRRAR